MPSQAIVFKGIILLISTLTILFGAAAVLPLHIALYPAQDQLDAIKYQVRAQATADPQDSSDQVVLSATAGFEGFSKANRWIPIRVRLENNGPDQNGRIEIKFSEFDADKTVYSYPLELPAAARKEVTLYIYLHAYTSLLHVNYVTGPDKSLAKIDLPLSLAGDADLLIGVLTETPSAFNLLSQVRPASGITRLAFLKLEDIPSYAHALASLDILFIANIDTGPLSSAQRQALSGWVASGGRLVLTGGVDAQKTASAFLAGSEEGAPAAQSPHELLPFIPNPAAQSLQVTGLQDAAAVSCLEALQAFAGSTIAIDNSQGGLVIAVGQPVENAHIVLSADFAPGTDLAPGADVDPSTDVASQNLTSPVALAIRKEAGFGEVIYLAFDPAAASLSQWRDMPAFYYALLGYGLPRASWADGVRETSSATDAAQSLSDLRLPSIFLIGCFLGIYVLALGPLNYLLLRLLKRRELGWLSIPAMVIFFTVLIFIFGSFSRGSQPTLNEFTLVQAFPGVSEARLDGVIGLYSPNRSTYKVKINNPFLMHYPIQNSREASVQQDGTSVSLPDIRIDVSGVETVSFEGSIPAPQFSSTLKVSTSTSTSLKGSISNTSSLALHDTVLLYPGGALRMNDFLPGETRNIDVNIQSGQANNDGNARPYPYNGIGSINPTNSSSYYGYDTTSEDILGTASFYDDREIYRRYQWISAISQLYATGGDRQSSYYLVGWSDQSLSNIQLYRGLTPGTGSPGTGSPGTGSIPIPYKSESTAMVVFQLEEPQFELVGNRLRIIPIMFQWKPMATSSDTAGPYNTYLYTDVDFAIEFTPTFPVEFSSVHSLTLHMDSYGNTGLITAAEVYLWNFEEGAWDKQTVYWGDNTIKNAAQLVDTNGAIRIRIVSTQSYLQLERADFTLWVNR